MVSALSLNSGEPFSRRSLALCKSMKRFIGCLFDAGVVRRTYGRAYVAERSSVLWCLHSDKHQGLCVLALSKM